VGMRGFRARFWSLVLEGLSANWWLVSVSDIKGLMVFCGDEREFE
jgi:hypothetical protein